MTLKISDHLTCNFYILFPSSIISTTLLSLLLSPLPSPLSPQSYVLPALHYLFIQYARLKLIQKMGRESGHSRGGKALAIELVLESKENQIITVSDL
jgi:hypothetical protein